MANGFFLGGFAEGADQARARGQTDRELGLREQALGIEQDADKFDQIRKNTADAQKVISDNFALSEKIFKGALERGVPRPEAVKLAAVPIQDMMMQPLTVAAARQTNESLQSTFEAMTGSVGAPGEVAETAGAATVAGQVGQVNALTNAGVSPGSAMETAGIKSGLTTDIISRRNPAGELVSEKVVYDRQGTIVDREVLGGGPTVQYQPPGLPGNTAMEAYQNSEVGTRVVIGDAKRIKEQLSNADTFTSAIGGMTTFANSLAGNLKQGASLLGFDDTPLFNEADQKYDFAAFGREAASSIAFKSNIVKLAYSLARAEDPGGRLSDRDVQASIDRLAAGSGDKAVISVVIDEVVEAAKRSQKARWEVGNRFSPGSFLEYPADLEPGQKAETSSAPAPKSRSAADYPDGTTAVVNGKRYVAKGGKWVAQ